MEGRVKVYYDLETTGVHAHRNGIHQLVAYIEVDGKVVERVNLKMKPHPNALIEPEALKIAGITEADLEGRPSMHEAFSAFKAILLKYLNPYRKGSPKATLVGFNNKGFDDKFIEKWFHHNGESYFFAWFRPDSHDVQVLASVALDGDERDGLPNFKLPTVAAYFGLGVEEAKLHDAYYDLELTYNLYQILTL